MDQPSKGLHGKCKKEGRNKNKCKAYLNRGMREKNKIRALTRHIAWQPNDLIAVDALKRVNKYIRGERAKRRVA